MNEIKINLKQLKQTQTRKRDGSITNIKELKNRIDADTLRVKAKIVKQEKR